MRVGFLSLAMIIVAFASAPGGLSSATRIALAQSQQPRNQTQPQEGGLPAEKRKALTTYGPEDVFGVSGDERNRSTPRPRNLRPTPTPLSSPPQRQPAASAVAPSGQPSVSPSQSTAVETSPTATAAALESGLQQSPLGQGSTSDRISPRWPAIGLLASALIVGLAL
ncbi:MAG TPA: hypothetical protein VG324_23040, partial [Blastocatellia bacterium]|nr:hypothetical protein [Blastocatellia bacterium]